MTGLPIAPPIGWLPHRVYGREEILPELRRQMSPRKGGVWVLAGMGGVGKSTVALAAAKMALDKGWRVCWINSVTTATLTGGVVEMLDQLNAPVLVIQAVRSGAASAAERTWNFLNSSNAARRALLVFDSADDLAVLAPVGEENPSRRHGMAATGALQDAGSGHYPS